MKNANFRDKSGHTQARRAEYSIHITRTLSQAQLVCAMLYTRKTQIVWYTYTYRIFFKCCHACDELSICSKFNLNEIILVFVFPSIIYGCYNTRDRHGYTYTQYWMNIVYERGWDADNAESIRPLCNINIYPSSTRNETNVHPHNIIEFDSYLAPRAHSNQQFAAAVPSDAYPPSLDSIYSIFPLASTHLYFRNGAQFGKIFHSGQRERVYFFVVACSLLLIVKSCIEAFYLYHHQ